MDSATVQELPRSMKNLWTLLSGSLNLKSLQFIADELEQNEQQLIDGILYYKKHDPVNDSMEKITAMKRTSMMKPNILYNLSAYLDLNAQQCFDLFQSYLLNEYKGTPEMAKSLFTNEKQMKNLFDNLWHYYYSERIFTLFCLKQILSHWKQSDHIYSKIFQDFLKHIDSENQISQKLIDQLKYLLKLNREPQSKCLNLLTEKHSHQFETNILKEQIEILQLLLLYFENFERKPENVLEVLNLFSQTGFKTKSSDSSNTLNVFCGFLKSLLIVQFFDLDNLHRCQTENVEHYLLKEENLDIIQKLDKIILSLNTSVQEHSLILFSWMIVLIFIDLEDSEDSVDRLGKNALQMKIFKYIEHCLGLEQMDLLKESFVYNLIYEILGNLMAVTFTVFEFEKLVHNEPALNPLLIQLFTNDLIAKIIFESSLATGLGLSIRYALSLFPFKTHLLLSMLNSLAQTKWCKKIFEQFSIINTLTTYTEKYDPSFTEFAMMDNNQNTIMLTTDRLLYENNGKLILAKGTKGVVFYHENCRLIKWIDINMDGWMVLYCRLKHLIHQIKQGQMYWAINNEVVLYEISKISFICAELILHNSHSNIRYFKKIVNHLLELFKLIVSVDQVSVRLFMAGIIKLCCSMMQHNYMNRQQIWSLLHEKRFFPYLIGFSNQFHEILSGTDTNISFLGYILASDEFIKGNYELTFSFLSFIRQLCKNGEYLEDGCTIASFMFIINDIFSSYKLWNYKKENDSHRIGRMCIDIFHHIVQRVRRKTVAQLNRIEKICIILLMEGNAAEQLLNIIKDGESIVKMKILNSGNECLLIHDDQIVSVRTSLLILSYLLEMYSEVTKLSSLKDKSVIEKIIFSSTNNSNPNMLLIFTFFVCQKYDIYLAINAIQLLNQLAFKFPMSMLACFGSNTEFIRDHFLFRLETITEDINFKIALLNFLSTCVETQPGLVEMFLNVANNQQTSVLNSIVEILEEKLEGQYHCPFELHHASLQFVAKFWLKPNIIAMNKLKKFDKFWRLVGFPLLNEDDSNDSLYSFILKIFSREIHQTKMLEKTDLDKNFEQFLDEMHEKKVFARISSLIQEKLQNPIGFNEDFIHLVDGWRDFLSAWTKLLPQPLQQPKLILTLINGLLNGISILISEMDDIDQTRNKLINKLSNLALIIVSNQELEKELSNTEDILENTVELFKKISSHKEFISLNAQISCGCFLLCLTRPRKSFHDPELFRCVADLLNNSFKLFAKQLEEGWKSNLNLEKRFIAMNLFNMISMLQMQNDEIFRSMKAIRCFEISEQILNLMIYLLCNEIHLDLAQNLSAYFVCITHFIDGADQLNNLNFVNQISINFRFPEAVFAVKIDEINCNHLIAIFSQLIRTVINMVIHLKHHFIDFGVTFVAVYMDTFQEAFKVFRTLPTTKIARLVLLILGLCSTLSKYVKIWNRNHSVSLQMLTQEILLTSNLIIAFILRPSVVILKKLENENLQPQQQQTMDSVKSSLGEDFHKLMIEMLLNSMQFLLDVSPSLVDVFEDETVAIEKHSLLISTNFSIPNIDSKEILTFGSLVNLINFLIKSIYRYQKDPKKRLIDQDSVSNTTLLEISLIFFCIQTLIAKSSPKLNQIDKQIFFHEINNEVNTFKSHLIFKPYPQRRQNSSPSLVKISPIKPAMVAGVNLLERPFIKFMMNLLENLIQ